MGIMSLEFSRIERNELRAIVMRRIVILALVLGFLAGMSIIAEAKSMYVIANHHTGQFDAWDIAAPGLDPPITYQATYNLTHANDPADVAVDFDSATLFITSEFDYGVELVDAKTMKSLDWVTGGKGLGGIDIDDLNDIVYTVKRDTDKIYVYDWDPVAKTLTLKPGYPKNLPNCGGAWGLALDEINELLYVADSQNEVVRVYDVATLTEVSNFAPSIPPVGIAVDRQRGFVYTTAPDGSCAYAPSGYTLLSKYDLATGVETTVDMGHGGMGIAVDEVTGYVYVTGGCSGDDISIWDSKLAFVKRTSDIGDPAGIAIGSVSYNPLNLAKNDTIVGYGVNIGQEFTYEITYDNKGNAFDATGVTAVDRLPAELDFVSETLNGVPDTGVYDSVARTVTWDIGTLSAGYTGGLIELVVRVNQNAVGKTVIYNYCTIESDQTPPTTVVGGDPDNPAPGEPGTYVIPSLIADFSASDGEDEKSTLTWTNPSDSDLDQVVVQRKVTGYPTDHTDGERRLTIDSAIPNKAETYVDEGLTNGKTYYYAVFSRDSTGNWNDNCQEGKNADKGTPQGGNQPPDTKIGPPKIDQEKKTATFTWSGSDDKTPPAQLVYEHRLLNPDSPLYGWSDWSSSTTATYPRSPDSRLPDGTYRFQVKAKDADEAIQPSPTTYKFTIGEAAQGTISGRVTDASIPGPSNGIVGAVLLLDPDPFTYCPVTLEGGYFSFSIPPGTYNVTASAEGYVSKTAVGVVVVAGATTLLDFALEPAPIAWVSTNRDGVLIFADDEAGNPNTNVRLKELPAGWVLRRFTERGSPIERSPDGETGRYQYVEDVTDGTTGWVKSDALTGVPDGKRAQLVVRGLAEEKDVALPGSFSIPGSKSGEVDEVRLLQYLLMAENLYDGEERLYSQKKDTAATGFFGEITTKALKAFQASHGLDGTGTLDIPTRLFFNSRIATGRYDLDTTRAEVIVGEARDIFATPPPWLDSDFLRGASVETRIGILLAVLAKESWPSIYRLDNELITFDWGRGLMQVTSDEFVGAGSGLTYYEDGARCSCRDEYVRCKSYYTNTRQGIRANLLDGLWALQGKWRAVSKPPRSQDDDVVDEAYGILRKELLWMQAIFKYQGVKVYEVITVYEVWDGKRNEEIAGPWTEEWLNRVRDVAQRSDSFLECLQTCMDEEVTTKYANLLYVSQVGERLGDLYDADYLGSPAAGYEDATLGDKFEYVNTSSVIMNITGLDTVVTASARSVTSAEAVVGLAMLGPHALSFSEDGTTAMFLPPQDFAITITGVSDGTYTARLLRIESEDVLLFTAKNIRTTSGAVHSYAIDWSALARGEEGVTVQIDNDGDGVFEQIGKADDELTADEVESFGVVPAGKVVNNGPNPVPDTGTTFFYALPTGATTAKLMIFNVAGRLLFETPLDVNSTRFPSAGTWNPVDQEGVPLANGPYIYVLIADGKVIGQGKMVIQR